MTIEYHEPPQELRPETRNLHRAFSTLVEELEAIDWYQHRIDTTDDDDLLELVTHNRNEEMEHAAMALEYLRRRIPYLEEQLRKYLFTETAITEKAISATPQEDKGSGDLGIGSLK